MIEREPDWSLLPASTPPAVRELIERCLVKSPRQRLQAIGDARLVLEETLANLQRPLSADAPAATAPAPVAAESPRVGAWRTLAVVLGVIAGRSRSGPGGARPPRHTAPARRRVAADEARDRFGPRPLVCRLGSSVALSPDGSKLAIVEGESETAHLYVRALDETEPVLLASGEADAPYQPFSLGRRKVGRLRHPDELRKVQVSGGTPLDLQGESQPGRHLAARQQHRVGAGSRTVVWSRVPAAGGEPSRSPPSTRRVARPATAGRRGYRAAMPCSSRRAPPVSSTAPASRW